MSGDKLQADKESLNGIKNGINDAIGELKSLGAPGEAAVGRGFSELSLTGLETGHDDLTSAFKEFCDRWEWGVRALMRDAEQFAERVGLAAGYYHERDVYISKTLKVAANATFGNPHLSDDQVEKTSWGDVLADNPYTQARDADFSADSFVKQGEQAKKAWTQTAKDLADSAETGGATPLGMAYRQMRGSSE